MMILQIFIGVVLAQLARAVILGSVWHLKELLSGKMRDAATGRYLGTSLWSKIQGVY